MLRIVVAIVSSSIPLFGLSAFASPLQPEQLVLHGTTMGTTFTAKVISSGLTEARAKQLREAVLETVERIDAKMSTYRPDSELSRFNRWSETTPFAVSDETFEVFQLALEASEWSGGTFDITVGPLVNAWGFGPEGRSPRRPTAATLRALLDSSGYRHLELDPTARTIRKELPEIYCDLSGVAKGYAVDRVAERLDEMGITAYMVEIGGEIRARGHNLDDRAWQLAIERPIETMLGIHRVVPISGASLATSGDYRHHYELDGKRVSHTIDPRIGRPVEHSLASVSVIHRHCALADAFATALMVLGPEEGLQLAVREGLAVLFLIRIGEAGLIEKMSPAFRRLYLEGGSADSVGAGRASVLTPARPTRMNRRSLEKGGVEV